MEFITSAFTMPVREPSGGIHLSCRRRTFVPGSIFVGRNVADGLPVPVPTILDTSAKLNAVGGSLYAIQLTRTHRGRSSIRSTCNIKSCRGCCWT